MSNIPLELREKAEQAKAGRRTSANVRTLLGWFGGQRRRQSIVGAIRDALLELSIRTEPDFEVAYIDERIFFLPAAPAEGQVLQDQALAVLADATASASVAPDPMSALSDPTYRIGKLPSANHAPVFVAPDDPIDHATTLMLKFDYSQLPIRTSPREVKGLFSWKSLASRLAIGKRPSRVLDCADPCHFLPGDTSLFDAIPVIVRWDCVLIRDHAGAVTGIVTTADLCEQFRQLTEPFLLLNEVEDHIRSMVQNRFSTAELASARDPSASARPVTRPADLTLGEYLRLLQNPANWQRLGVAVARTVFADSLREVLDIRNDVMHFDPDGLENDQLIALQRCVSFLRRLQEITNA